VGTTLLGSLKVKLTLHTIGLTSKDIILIYFVLTVIFVVFVVVSLDFHETLDIRCKANGRQRNTVKYVGNVPDSLAIFLYVLGCRNRHKVRRLLESVRQPIQKV